MNTRKKGYYRDKEVRESIEMYGVLTTEQIYLLHFREIKYGIVKCRERLRKLVEKGKIEKVRFDINEAANYYIGEMPYYLEHTVNRNWGFIYLMEYVRKEMPYFKLVDIRFKEKVINDEIRPDGLIGFKNYVTGEYRYWFIESDRVESKNKFTKVKQYVELYEKNGYVNEYWYDRVERFPHILIVTNSETKKKRIEECVKKENKRFNENNKNNDNEDDKDINKDKLKFIVKTVDEIRDLFF